MIVTCEGCQEKTCSCCEAEEIETGIYVCPDCIDGWKEQISAFAVGAQPINAT